MKSLVGNKNKARRSSKIGRGKRKAAEAQPAQCCAKTSKIVAGCHD